MNTIPLIFNERQIKRTVLWGREKVPGQKLESGVILLNGKGSQFRDIALRSLSGQGFREIVCIESGAGNYSTEDLAHKFPFIKFIVPLESATEGELINIGMSEMKSDYVLVLRDCLACNDDFISPRILERICAQRIFAVAPRLMCASSLSVPSVFSPTIEGAVFKVASSTAVSDGLATLYPMDNIAVYDRKKFMQLGGFDYTIANTHWQTADLFFRAWLWGEKVALTTLLSFTYSDSFPVEDLTADVFYSRFYLKNILPRFDEDHGVIPKSSFFVYLSRSGSGLIESLRQFNDARSWVRKNKYRFKLDAKYLVENWGKL